MHACCAQHATVKLPEQLGPCRYLKGKKFRSQVLPIPYKHISIQHNQIGRSYKINLTSGG